MSVSPGFFQYYLHLLMDGDDDAHRDVNAGFGRDGIVAVWYAVFAV